MKIHHIGYAVKSIEKSRKDFQALGYREEGNLVFDQKRNVAILFLTNGSVRVELVEAGNPAEPSPVDNWLKNSVGGGKSQPYHLCYEVPQIEWGIQELKKEKFILTERPAPAPAIQGRRVAFLYKRSVGLIELVEIEDEKKKNSGTIECKPVPVNPSDGEMGAGL